MLSYHYYEPPDFSKTLNFHARMSDLKRLKCGGFLTETYTVGKDYKGMEEMFDLADQYKQSWQGWMYKPYGCIEEHLACDNTTNHSGDPGEIVVQNTSRTYPQAVAGFTDSYKFNKDTKAFQLSYRINAACKSSVTEIYFNKAMHYPSGFDHELSPVGKVTMSISENGFLVLLQHDSDIEPDSTVTFSMVPKP